MRIRTPAKINTILHILNKREDGFHELYMHMLPVSLFDILDFSVNNSDGLRFQMEGAQFDEPDEKNLVVRAVRLFEKQFQLEVHLDVLLKKNIPSGAGLGGGSGNAAGTLIALQKIFSVQLKQTHENVPAIIFELAEQLGSDVPFFLEPQVSEVQGRGEKVNALENYPELPIIIIKPDFSIPTPEAYKNCIPEELDSFPLIQTKEHLQQKMFNQFEQTLFENYPELLDLKERLILNGAFGALVSGSGSSVFGVFDDKNLQKQTFESLKRQHIGEVFACRMMKSYSYF